METLKKTLFDNIILHNHKLTNRLAVAPMTRRSASPDGIPTDLMADYYQDFAKGGFSLIITEGTYTDADFSQSDINQPGIVQEAQVAGWKKVVQKVHDYGALIICQLMHGGALSQYSEVTIGPSAVRPVGIRATEAGGLKGQFPIPREMTAKDFETVKAGYVDAARRAVKAGFDGIEIHAANGYLFDQFITEHTNLRLDNYGGSVRNRLRFLMEVFTAIKAAVPSDFIIGIRLSESKVNDLPYRWPGGSATADEIFTILSEIDPAYYHIAAEGGRWERECLYPDGRSSTGIAKLLTGVPVIANGGMHDINLAEALLNSNQADLISIGRAALASPDWPNLVVAGKPVIPFFKELIKPSLTLEHTRSVLRKAC